MVNRKQNNQTTSSDTTEEALPILRKPLMSIGYISVIFLGVLLNLMLMILCFFIIRPSDSDSSRTALFLSAISIFVPLFGTFLYCLAGSLRMPGRITISPSYVMLFTSIPTLALGGYVEYSVSHLLLEDARMNSVFAYLFLVVLAYVIWIYLSISVFHPVIRGLVGANADRDNIQKGMKIYLAADLEHILDRMEDKKWLSNICSMTVVDRREEQGQIKLKLSKYNTNFYLSIYGKQVGSECFVSLTPYELIENPAEKVVLVNDDSRNGLKLQMSELEHTLGLTLLSTDKPQILYNSANYTMSPARFPGLQKYRNQIIVSVFFSTATVIAVLARLAGSIDDNQFLGAMAILAALGSTAFVTASGKG
jgi:hypothetical protein